MECVIINVDQTTSIEFTSEESEQLWKEFVVNNSDFYGLGVINYASRLAKYVQYLMKNHNAEFSSVIYNASNLCDIEGITGFMYGYAINILSQCWKYGDDLRKWHNKQYNHDGDGVVNPAILTVELDN